MKEYAIGVDLGGTRIKIGLVSEGAIMSKKIIPADSITGLASNLENLEKEIHTLLRDHNVDPSALTGIGLAFPGLVDPISKKILSTNEKYNDAISMDMNAWVKEHWNTRFFLDNDARMAAVAEWKYGAATDTDNMVAMTIGTGIGTSAIIEGKLLRGKHFQAGCLGGHFSIQFQGKPCNCGNIGCLEAYGSTWSLKERAASAEITGSMLSTVDVLDFSALFDAAKKGDDIARRIQHEYLDVWSAGVINLIHAYDPEVVVIGGGVMNSQDVIIPYITQKVQRHAWTPWGQVQIRPSSLLSDAGILGVVYCLQHENV